MPPLLAAAKAGKLAEVTKMMESKSKVRVLMQVVGPLKGRVGAAIRSIDVSILRNQ